MRPSSDDTLMLSEILELIDMLRRGGLIELASGESARRGMRVGARQMTSSQKRAIMISVAATAGMLSYRIGDDDEREGRGLRSLAPVYAALDELRDALNRRYAIAPYALYDLRPPKSARAADLSSVIALLIVALNSNTPAAEIGLDPAIYLSGLPGHATAADAQAWALDQLDNDR